MFLDSILLCFFGVGISSSSQIIFNSFSQLNSEYNSRPIISIKPIITFVGILFFCTLINALLLIPSILSLIVDNDKFLVLVTKNAIFISKLFFILISVFGFLQFIQIIRAFLKKKSLKLKSEFYYIFCLIISFLIYFAVSPKSIDIHYDTGAYHLPYVLHLSSFAVEKGLAYLNFGYGFYHLNFFGQVPIQNFFNLSNYISPSLNILFFSTYLWFFLSEYKTSKEFLCSNEVWEIKRKLPFLVVIYFLISLVFYPENIFNSLSSYSAAMPQFICGSIVLYAILFFYKFSNLKYSFISILFLTLYSPILKGTGLLLSAYLTILIIFFGIISYKKKYNKFNFIYLKTYFARIFEKYIKNEKTIFFVIFSYLIALITNVIMSGYPLYPYKFFGPIGKHAFPISKIALPKYVVSWHRFSFNDHVFPEKYTIFDWLPNYLTSSKDGVTIILFWVIPVLIAIVFQLVKIRYSKKIVNKNFFPEIFPNYLLKFSLSLFVLQLLIIFFLIPVSVYIPWVVNISIFVFYLSGFDFLYTFGIDIKKNLKILTFAFIFIIPLFISLFSIKNKIILTNLSSNFFSKPYLPDIKKTEVLVKPKNWETSFRLKNGKVKVTYPNNGDQCWSTPPPCIRGEYVIDEF